MIIDIISDKKIVKEFLKRVIEISNSETFNIATDFFINYKKSQNVRYLTTTLLSELDFDICDVLSLIKELTIEDYSHTKIDNDIKYDGELLHVFGKYINNELVYIKLKIRKKDRNQIICLSFHYAESDLDFPYKKSGGKV